MWSNVFVLGLDDLNSDTLRKMPDVDRYRFHPILTVEDLLYDDEIRFEELLAKARAEMHAFAGRVDALIGLWDFPVSSMAPILRSEFGLVGPTLEAVVKCEHKYWSRLEQQKAIDAYPRFAVVDPTTRPAPPPGLRYPLWVKPVKSYASELAFRVETAAEFDAVMAAMRVRLPRVGLPFDAVLSRLDLPPEIVGVGGVSCLVEETIQGAQATVEGYLHHGEVCIYGVVDSVCYPNSSSFLRYQYPSGLPAVVQRRMGDLAARVVRQVDLAETAFNVEFFWDPVSDAVLLLEVNPRPSQSHAKLFAHVDGAPNLQCLVRLALGREPDLPRRRGRYPIAAKWFLRRFAPGRVRRSPTSAEVARIEGDIPGTTIVVVAPAGRRLSELTRQDSYSYELADVYVGADDETELVTKYERCVERLVFDVTEEDEDADGLAG